MMVAAMSISGERSCACRPTHSSMVSLGKYMRGAAVLGTLRLPVRSSVFRGTVYQPFSTSAMRRSVSLIYNLFPTCNSCGIKLQDEDPAKPGFYRLPEATPKLVKPEDEVFNSHMSDLSAEDQRLLLNSDDGRVPQSSPPVRKNQERSSEDIKCIRCRNAMYRSDFDWNELPIESLDTVMATIPPDGNLVYVINAVDFPFSLNRSIFKYRNPAEIKFVVTKCDLLFPTASLGAKYGSIFFKDYLSRMHGIDPSNVIVTSGLNDWNMKEIINVIGDNSYVIGQVNSGKSTFLKSLLYTKEKMKPTYRNARQETRLQKQQDKLINHNGMNKFQSAKSYKKDSQAFKRSNGPGTSYMPGFTRGHIIYDINGKTIIDVPGFNTNDDSHGMYKYLSPSTIKTLSKGVRLHKRGRYDSHYDSIKNGQVLTVGGLFYLAAPPDAIYQVRSCINHKFHVFNNMDKAKSVLQNIESYDSLQNVFLVNKSSLDNLQRFIIPPFHGSIDLVVKDLGHINITPTGKRMNAFPMVIYLPEGVDAIIRQPLTKYITRTLAGRDKNGNPLKKELWRSKSVTHLQRYNGVNPFTSALIPSTSSNDFESISSFVSKINDSEVTYDEDSTIGDSNKFDYWIKI